MSLTTFYEQIPLSQSKTYIIREFWDDELTYPFHHHPFFEINYVEKTSGSRIVGQKISEFEENDLTLIAPGLPHQFKNQMNDNGEKIHSIIIQFHPLILGKTFFERDETTEIVSLLEKAKRGIAFGKSTIKLHELKLKRLLNMKGFNGLLLFLEILNDMAKTDDFMYLSEIDWQESISGKGKELTDRVFHYIFNHFTEDITLKQVAEVAGLSKSAFSHFFKKRSGKTYSEFVNELRISHSLKLLTESEKSIAEICYESGFGNISYFNRVFKSLQKQTPREYRMKHNILFSAQ